jgi:hypothetical protein
MSSSYAPIAGESPTPANASASPPERRAGPSRRGAILRRIRFWTAFALVIAVGALLYAVWQSQVPQGQLNIDSPTPEGARAAAVLLRAHGAEVEQSKDIPATISRAEQGNATLFLAAPELLSARSMRRIAALPSTVRIVLAEPDEFTLSDLGLRLQLRGSRPYAISAKPDCDFAEAASAGSAEVSKDQYEPGGADTLCYGDSLAVATVRGGAQVVVFGAHELITNDRLGEDGNAALVVGVLSGHGQVLWLRPAELEKASGERRISFQDILPPWVGWAQLLLLIAALLAILWRMRRIGPPVAEPLPVVVRSAETAEGRARMYRRARARTEAFEALRAGAMARLLPPLGLGSEPDYRAVVESVAERTGAPMSVIHSVLYGPPPTDDAALVSAADTLDALVRDVLHPRRPADLNRPDGEGPTQ